MARYLGPLEGEEETLVELAGAPGSRHFQGPHLQHRLFTVTLGWEAR